MGGGRSRTQENTKEYMWIPLFNRSTIKHYLIIVTKQQRDKSFWLARLNCNNIKSYHINIDKEEKYDNNFAFL